MIYQSVAKQYGILPNNQDKMHYSEWVLLVGGIMEDTPLGQVVLIRKESDCDRLKHFTKHENRIRNEWRNFRAKQKSERDNPEKFSAYFEEIFSAMFA